MKSRRPTDACLSLLQVNYWILGPQLGLESLKSTGKIDVDALRTLNSLMDLVAELTRDKPLPAVDATPIQRLAALLNDQSAVDEDEIEAAQAWLDHVRRLLLATKRVDYQNAVNHLVLVAESRELLRQRARDAH